MACCPQDMEEREFITGQGCFWVGEEAHGGQTLLWERWLAVAQVMVGLLALSSPETLQKASTQCPRHYSLSTGPSPSPVPWGFLMVLVSLGFWLFWIHTASL